MLRQWISPDAATQRYLATHNGFDLVQCLTSTGMRYLLKAQTVNSRRLHKKLYYDHTLVNVLLPTMLKHAGKSEPTFLELTRHFVLSGSPCALLGLRNRLTRRRLMEDLWTLEPITSLRRKCINKCTKQGEWTVLSHDATFKSFFSVLGQDKMSQKAGESTQCTPSWAKVVHCLASVRNTQRAKHASGMLLKPCYLLTRDKQHDGFSQTHRKQSWQQLQICIQVSLGWLKIQYIWSSASKPALENAEHHALAYVCIYRRSLQSLRLDPSMMVKAVMSFRKTPALFQRCPF